MGIRERERGSSEASSMIDQQEYDVPVVRTGGVMTAGHHEASAPHQVTASLVSVPAQSQSRKASVSAASSVQGKASSGTVRASNKPTHSNGNAKQHQPRQPFNRNAKPAGSKQIDALAGSNYSGRSVSESSNSQTYNSS